jgi:hypothetical protein
MQWLSKVGQDGVEDVDHLVDLLVGNGQGGHESQ